VLFLSKTLLEWNTAGWDHDWDGGNNLDDTFHDLHLITVGFNDALDDWGEFNHGKSASLNIDGLSGLGGWFWDSAGFAETIDVSEDGFNIGVEDFELSLLVNVVNEVLEGWDNGDDLWDAGGGILDDILSEITSFVEGLTETVLDIVSNILHLVSDIGSDVLNLVEGVLDAIEETESDEVFFFQEVDGFGVVGGWLDAGQVDVVKGLWEFNDQFTDGGLVFWVDGNWDNEGGDLNGVIDASLDSWG